MNIHGPMTTNNKPKIVIHDVIRTKTPTRPFGMYRTYLNYEEVICVLLSLITKKPKSVLHEVPPTTTPAIPFGMYQMHLNYEWFIWGVCVGVAG